MKRVIPSRIRPARQGGVALIEALVAVLIVAFGVMGLVGLQAAMTRAQGSAKFRSDASYLGSQIIGAMWADRSNVVQYDSSTCASYSRCNDWMEKVGSALPAGAATISAAASGDVSLTVTWSTTAEGTHSYVVSTSVR
jgi:type IV pilus assembly protein PilV